MAASAKHTASKSSKKKAAKVTERPDSPSPSSNSGHVEKHDPQDDSFESSYIKELQKTIRNINKKISNASKTDSQLKEHPGKSLDELVDAKVINTDQKAQILKRPALQAQLVQAEEQLAQYQKVHEQYRDRAAADKATWESSLEKVKEAAVNEAKKDFEKKLHENLLTLSQFLRLAAFRREESQDPESDENQAIEGVLLNIYSGDDGAVRSMLKLVEGSDDKVLSVPGEQLQTTYSNVRDLAQSHKASPSNEDVPETTASVHEVAMDPTVTHASASDIAAGDTTEVNGVPPDPATNGISNSEVSNAANHIGESRWDSNNDTSLSQEWVDVNIPRDPAETETGLAATPAAAANKQSWADDTVDIAPEAALVGTSPAEPNDGFHQVQRNKRTEREGGHYRGRGRGEWRGRGGYRGDGRGRGRGNRGAGMTARGHRRNEEP